MIVLLFWLVVLALASFFILGKAERPGSSAQCTPSRDWVITEPKQERQAEIFRQSYPSRKYRWHGLERNVKRNVKRKISADK